MNTIRKLISLYDAGMFNIEISSDGESATIGGRAITKQEASVLCKNFGWESWKMSPYTIIDKTRKFIRSIKNHITDDGALDSYMDFKNNYTRIYGKYCDRIHIIGQNGVEKSIVYNMPDNRWKYTVFDPNSIPCCGFVTAKKLAEYINTTFKTE